MTSLHVEAPHSKTYVRVRINYNRTTTVLNNLLMSVLFKSNTLFSSNYMFWVIRYT